jgi:hypothetical protein
MPLYGSLFILITSFAYASDAQNKVINVALQDRAVLVKSNVEELGYRVGDIAHQTVEVITPKGYRLDETSIPAIGKGGCQYRVTACRLETNRFW